MAAPTEVAGSAEEVDRVRERLSRLFRVAAQEKVLSERLVFARTTVQIDIADAPEPTTISLLLDRVPPEVVDGPIDDPEIGLVLTTEDLDGFIAGDLHLAMAIAHGRVESSGPVRKLLRAAPIVRGISRRLTAERAGA